MVLFSCLWQFISYKIVYYFQIRSTVAIKESSRELFTTRCPSNVIFHNASNNKLLLQPSTLFNSKHNGPSLNNKPLKTIFKSKLLILCRGPSPFLFVILTPVIIKSIKKQSIKTNFVNMAGCLCFLQESIYFNI